jgi:hypothetical protein
VHLVVWAVLAALTTSLAPPTGGEVAFSAVVVVLSTVVAAAAYRAPRRRQSSQPAVVGAVAVLEVVTFVVHGLVLTLSLAEVRRHVGGGPLALEVAMTVGALVGVMLLFRHEVEDGVAGAGARSAEPGVPGPS